MSPDESTQGRIAHPLELLAQLEQRMAEEQGEALLSSSPSWGELLTDYAVALTELAENAARSESLQDVPRLDDGHAGGCG